MKLSETIVRLLSLAMVFTASMGLLAVSVLIIIPAYSYSSFIKSSEEISDTSSVSEVDLKQLAYKAAMLERNFKRLVDAEYSFLIINTTDNTFKLYRNRKMIGDGLCSTGSLIHLEIDSTRTWFFETPRGVLRVKNKIVDPVWHKPDWAFIEEGLQPPPPGHSSRYVKGVLGEYALDLGNGYFIHGTLYQRMLGMSVTHGCVRLNDFDLKLVYQTMDVGSKVYIY